MDTLAGLREDWARTDIRLPWSAREYEELALSPLRRVRKTYRTARLLVGLAYGTVITLLLWAGLDASGINFSGR